MRVSGPLFGGINVALSRRNATPRRRVSPPRYRVEMVVSGRSAKYVGLGT